MLPVIWDSKQFTLYVRTHVPVHVYNWYHFWRVQYSYTQCRLQIPPFQRFC